MAKIMVAGLINIETTLKVDQFSLDYVSVRFPFYGIQTAVSGVGYNITTALSTLGHKVCFLSLVGDDLTSALIRKTLVTRGILDQYIVSALSTTPQSVIIFNNSGQRIIFSDLKDVQETVYPTDQIDFNGVDLAVLTNINFSRSMLTMAQQAHVPIATDVHVIRDLEDDYNRDYMAAADILFMSDEGLPVTPHDWIQQLWHRYNTSIVGIGLGDKGAILGVKSDQRIVYVPAHTPRPVVNTIGAGDALFASFLHGYVTHGDPYTAMQEAVLFAGYKIGGNGGADGFLDAADLEALYAQYSQNQS